MFYVVRHGQTDWNVIRRYQGDTDTLLNEAGLRQAAGARDFLADFAIDRIVCSTLRRTRDTASIINEKHHAPVLYTEQLVERGYGDLEGSFIADHLQDEYHARLLYMDTEELPWRIETSAALCRRVFGLLSSLEERYPGENILIVTHGGTIGAINAYFRGFGEGGRKLMTRRTGNCSVLAYSRREDAGGTFPDPLYSADL